MTGLKLPFWGLSFVEFWCWGLIFGGQGGPGPLGCPGPTPETHILVEENQVLLLIDVPIQDRAQQIQIYKIINLPVPVGNYSMRYTMDNKYLGVTYDRTKAMDIPEDQFKLCKEANGQFCPLTTPLQTLMNLPSCVAALYTKNS